MITTTVDLGPRTKGGDYDIEITPRAIIVRGHFPLEDFNGIAALAKSKGFDIIDVGLCSAMGATLVITSKEHAAALRAEIEEGLAGLSLEEAWLRGTDTGTSSRTIFSVLYGKPSAADLESHGHPCDPDDFNRCYRLLKKIPGWRPRIGEMASVSPEWKALVENWEELERIYEEENTSKSAPKLWARMQDLIKGAKEKTE